MAKLNAERDTVTARQYRVRSYPTVMVLQSDGTEIDRVVGYARAPEFIAQIEDYLAGKKTLASLLAVEPTLQPTPEFEATLGDRLVEHGLFDEARARYLLVVAMDPEDRSGRVGGALMSLAYLCRRDHDYDGARHYAQTIIDKYPQSDALKSAVLEVGIDYKRAGDLERARRAFLSYVKRFPDDEDAPYAQEQADTLAARIARKSGA
jgi:tetratricopeptide (TPR) repeat protein